MATSLNPTFVQQIANVVQDQIRGLTNNKLARVTHVVYGPYYFGTNIPDPYYIDPTSIGLITYQYLDSNQNRTSNSSGNPPAKPLNSNIKKFPTNGEIVSILTGPSTQMNEDREAPDFYYTEPFNLWNAVHHNAFPDMGDYQQFTTNTKKSYQLNQATNQANNVSYTGSVNYPLAPKFPEKPDVKNLRIFPGDITIEGRWGNSIRFGSTTSNGAIDNPWSRNPESTPGNPITIIRNGQGKQLDNEGWIPTIENINRDPSSIYLTNGQEITIADIQNNFSLASLQVSLQSVVINPIPLQQSLTSVESISAFEQDQNASYQPSEPINQEVTQVSSSLPVSEPTPVTQPPPAQPIPQVQTQNATNARGTFIKDYTNKANQIIELFYQRKGFTTIVYGYLKSSGNIVYTGQPSNSTSTSIETLAREAELTLENNIY